MATSLPTNIDATYADGGSASRKVHQQAHDAVHAYTNTHDGAADPHPGYVLESLVDAKGDLLVGSAADTVVRKAVGADGLFLKADAASAGGVTWAAGPGLAASTASVVTTETTATGLFPYVDLATVGPAVTVTTGTTALVHFAAGMLNAGGGSRCAVVVSGATTRAGTDLEELYVNSTSLIQIGRSVLMTGLTPGSNTFTLKYAANGGTASFQNRSITVIPL